MNEIIPTVVPKSLADVSAAVARYGRFAQTLHIDATDGDFAFPTTWMPKEGERVPTFGGIFEAHVMVRDARSAGEAFARAGVWRIIAHAEALGTADEAANSIRLWKTCGAREAGAALLFGTPLDTLDPIAGLIDCIHVMTIGKIGKQGATMDVHAVDRVRSVRARFPNMIISVDGGVNGSNITELARAGASRFCIGAALSHADKPEKLYEEFRSEIEI